ADSDGVVALDARIEIEPGAVERPGPNPDLAIRPYPSGWESDIAPEGMMYQVRPIRPADIALYPAFFAKVSADDLRLRFLAPRRNFSDQMLKRLTQLDYDREMAFVALEKPTCNLAGIVRLSADPDHEIAEFGLLVRSDLQGHGLGFALLRRLIDYAIADGLKRIEGVILSENTKMVAMCREFGFVVTHHNSEPGLLRAVLHIGGEAERDPVVPAPRAD
ncbi:MAG TPA: GNAT family N-acetyltransferase, partial [Devosia sp.]|nr:GNAT family N-acetyltransferase [Devosia sp.]